MANHKGTILAVEDHRGMALLIATELGALDYEVVRAFTFADGLNQIRTRVFDLYIINSVLPDGSGIELCKQIRASNPKAPIILTSGGDHKKEFSEAKAAGVNCILSKPYKPATLGKMVTRLLFQ